jgi:uncharacterized membrane-anchored protein
MDDTTLQAFFVGLSAGTLMGGMVGYSYGNKNGKGMAKPEFRVILAIVIVVIWATSQTISLAFGTTVDPWLNVIMGAVAGFFFGDGLIEGVLKK